MQPDFTALDLAPALLGVVGELGYETPTPIQAAAIPVLLSGRDLIGQSKTGSGKTAAFALAILQHVDLAAREPQALVICPTRELSAQVAREFRKLGRAHADLVVLELTGGQPARPQRDSLGRGVHIAVGTPGRVLDHLERGALDPGALRTLVLDEADRMLDMGFEEEVNRILKRLPAARQTALFSATFPERIEAMSQRVQRDPVRVTIDEPTPEANDPERPAIRQLYLEVEPADKLHALAWLLQRHPHESALIFCNFKASVAALTRELSSAGVSVDRLDGDLEQFQRDQVLARFRNQSLRLLVATDVAGRGIDVEGLDLVVNFELPLHAETYLHRIGRTGRAGMSGLAISLTEPGTSRLGPIEDLTGVALEREPYDPRDADLDALLRGLARRAPMDTLQISGGRKDKVRPGDILGALTGDAGGLSRADVGLIEVRDHLAYVAVASHLSQVAVQRLNQGRIKGKRFRATLVRSSAPPRP
ncbi:MAG: ATP-dependent RNA helicase DbpA [Planctomycetota bacterium]